MTDRRDAEQSADEQESQPLPDDDQATGASEPDPWEDAVAEEDAASARIGGGQVFRPLQRDAAKGAVRDLDMIMDIPVRLTVELGRTRVTIKQLLELAQGSVIELDGLAGEPMDILINDYLIAQGEVVVVDDRYGIRITEIITPSERVQKLNR
ncbi:flagellar motor switch protein FliN/FliY [Halomonas ventosae]|uniref:Flagellar motor switch protein FliN n=1 Tax=Halomonas ventosae TaxID=229007 RepID=A0A4R6ZTJ9_9GAMM|nr:flagellar motor switch protein FliN [Halomonas ventosae]TDR56107.1 flagellar motor switch protein FliN/FliY [Halomonas ventosae]